MDEANLMELSKQRKHELHTVPDCFLFKGRMLLLQNDSTNYQEATTPEIEQDDDGNYHVYSLSLALFADDDASSIQLIVDGDLSDSDYSDLMAGIPVLNVSKRMRKHAFHTCPDESEDAFNKCFREFICNFNAAVAADEDLEYVIKVYRNKQAADCGSNEKLTVCGLERFQEDSMTLEDEPLVFKRAADKQQVPAGKAAVKGPSSKRSAGSYRVSSKTTVLPAKAAKQSSDDFYLDWMRKVISMDSDQYISIALEALQSYRNGQTSQRQTNRILTELHQANGDRDDSADHNATDHEEDEDDDEVQEQEDEGDEEVQQEGEEIDDDEEDEEEEYDE
eukprot:TRINITY_DN12486_c0_g2_i4.p2 TRINITY_DN12486_c0_g2~~TRINITY_DN12486_c0_g2_i4.p2  ORF type:complete len:335 (+),score=85.78 TRINITY_DN12486_c0_g2_i4:1928-2932(+)